MSKKNFKAALSYMRFEALTELMLDQIEESQRLQVYDPNLHTKLKNLKANFERVSKKTFSMVEEGNSRQWFYAVTEMFEKLFAIEDPEEFTKISDIIIAYQHGHVRFATEEENEAFKKEKAPK